MKNSGKSVQAKMWQDNYPMSPDITAKEYIGKSLFEQIHVNFRKLDRQINYSWAISGEIRT